MKQIFIFLLLFISTLNGYCQRGDCRIDDSLAVLKFSLNSKLNFVDVLGVYDDDYKLSLTDKGLTLSVFYNLHKLNEINLGLGEYCYSVRYTIENKRLFAIYPKPYESKRYCEYNLPVWDSLAWHRVRTISKLIIETGDYNIEQVNGRLSFIACTKCNKNWKFDKTKCGSGCRTNDYSDSAEISLKNLTHFAIVSPYDTLNLKNSNLLGLNITDKLNPESLISFSIVGGNYNILDFLKKFNKLKILTTDKYVNIELKYLDSLNYLISPNIFDAFANNIVNCKIKNNHYDCLFPQMYFYQKEGVHFRLFENDHWLKYKIDSLKNMNYTGYLSIYLKKDIFGGRLFFKTTKPNFQDTLVFTGEMIKGVNSGVWRYKKNIYNIHSEIFPWIDVVGSYYLEYDYDKVSKKYEFPENGIWEYRYNDGKICIKGLFKNGEKVGTWFFYNPDQTISSIKYFKNDIPYGIWSNSVYTLQAFQLNQLISNYDKRIKYVNGYTGYFKLDDKTIFEFKNGEKIKEIKGGTQEFKDAQNKFIHR